MKILVVEYVTGGGLAAEPIPAALAREGDRMLGALLRDLSRVSGTQRVALRDGRLGLAEAAATEWIMVVGRADWERHLAEQIALCDAVWPIAPETDGLLEALCRRVETAGKLLLNCPAEAVRLAASKQRTLHRLETAGIPVVPTVTLEPPAHPPFRWPVVVKPDDGAGCAGLRLIDGPDAWEAVMTALAQDEGSHLAQPLIEGEALSLSLLCARGQSRLLSVNRQRLRRDGDRLHLTGCLVNAIADCGRFRELAAGIAHALPELWGYVGVDLVQSRSGLHVLEVNPRLTTSYAGLGEALGINPAAWVLTLRRDGHLPALPLGPGRIVAIDLESSHGD